jgi:sodium/proline symporter
VGAVTVVLWKSWLDPMLGWKLYEIVPGFVLASVAIVVVSLLGKRPSPQMERSFDEVDAALLRA